ncbi:MAG: SRPBCC family protein [Actinomycetota bacterium]|nr:SRPBCC family protein [Actinomycetota bacterium]
MTRVERTIEIDAPPERVFELLTDLDRLQEWATIAGDAENPPAKPLAQGATWKHKLKVAGVELEGDWNVVAIDPPRLVEYEANRSEGGWLKMRQRVAPAGGGSRVELEVDYELPWGVLGEAVDKLVVERRNDREAEESLQNLKNILEGRQPKHD